MSEEKVVELFPLASLDARWSSLSDVEKELALSFAERVKSELARAGLTLDDRQLEAAEALREMFFPGPIRPRRPA